MLSPHDRYREDRWSGGCDGCLATLPPPWVYEGTQAEVLAMIVERFGWEIRPGDLLWCVSCSRKAREVPFPLTRRGSRGRRR